MFTCLYCDYNSAIGDDSLKLASKCSSEQTCTSLDQECTIKDWCRKGNIRRQQDFLHVIRGRPFDFDQRMGDFMGLRKIFFPQTSGDRMFFPDIQSYCMAGISLKDFFVLKIRLQDIFSEITYTTPCSKVK